MRVGSNTYFTRRCDVVRMMDVASSFLIFHLSISSFSVTDYFLTTDLIQLTPFVPFKLMDTNHASSVGKISGIIDLITIFCSFSQSGFVSISTIGV